MGSLRSRRKGTLHPCLRSTVNLAAFWPSSNTDRQSNQPHCQLLPSGPNRYGGEDGHPASAATLTISPRPCCYANTPKKRRPVCWKIPTPHKTSQTSLSSC